MAFGYEQTGLMADDLANKMMKCWSDPFSTEHDPRHLLMLGATEIRRLRRLTITMDEMLADMHNQRKPEPQFMIFVVGLAMIAGLMMLLWTLVRPAL